MFDTLMNPEPDACIEDLVSRSQNGEREAFASLYKEFAGPVYRYIYTRVSRTEQAEDLTQEVFVKALANIHSFRFENKPFASWLFTIAHNLVIDYYRQSSRKPSVAIEDWDSGDADDPVTAIEQDQEISAVKRAIEGLPAREKEVISLRFGTELSITETARITGTSEGSVKKLQHEAIVKLRRQIEKSERSNLKVNGLFFDYDGTISPLNVPRQLSRIPSHMEALLDRMRRFVRIGIITAKDLNFILPRTSFAHAWGAIAGLEIKTGSQPVVADGVKQVLPSLNQALDFAHLNSGDGVVIEEKCDYSGQALAFCVDWRRASNRKKVIQMTGDIISHCKELSLKIVRYPGKPYFDVFCCSINKGKALKQLKNTLSLKGKVLYMGDSLMDNAAFNAADISIGVTGETKAPDLHCQYWINFEEVAGFLDSLFKNDFNFSPALPGIRLK